MNRVLGRCLAGLAVVTGALSLAAGCVHDDSSFFVQNVIFPTPQGAGTECLFTANPSQSFLSRGTVDTSFRGEYTAWFLVANQLVTESNPNQVQTETSNINIQGAVVRDTDTAGNQLDNFTSLTSGTVYAAVGGTPGYAATQVTVVSQKALKATGAGSTVVGYVKFFGHTLGGDYIESNEFEFPVDVCSGCLITIAPTDMSTCYAIPNCECAANPLAGGCTGGGSMTSTNTLPCVPGQDTQIDCSQCAQISACRPNMNNPVNSPVCAVTDAGAGGG
jgi:hypothetical protein